MMNHYDEIKKQCLIIRLKSQKLGHLATAFFEVGNETMYLKLSDMATELDDARRQIEKAMSDKLNHDYKEMQQSIGKTLSVMAKEENTDDREL